MSWKVKDLTGMSFGTLTVIEQAQRSKHNQVMWLCRCTCGKEYPILAHSLVTGNTTKCNDHPKNDWFVVGDHIEIDVGTPNHPGKRAKIDKDDFERCMWRKPKTKWLFHDSAPGEPWGEYVVDSNRKLRLHRFVMRLEDPQLVVDHINGDTMDNRKQNLRVITRAENNLNMRLRSNNSSGYTGVTYKGNRWKATIVKDGATYALGNYDSPQEAHAAYCGAARVLGFSERHINQKTHGRA